jgi:alkanesulfonate monooxygenase SsuD/methylene tetrahydromethanopterin reductase-like flavin-dependent oxidoreductase (luciferase family)
LKLGITIIWRGASIEATRKIALEADQLGFEYLWITEAWGLEALSTVGYLLDMTKRIKIGTGILNVYSRSAALIGMACATFGQISPGRFVLGLGTSARAVIQDWHGMRFEQSLKRTKEYVDIIKKVARGEAVDYEGEVLKLSRFRLLTKPLEEDPQIYLGAMGEENLKLAGRISNGAIVTMYPISKFGHAFDLVSQAEPNRKEKLVFAYLPAAVTRSDDERAMERQRVARNISFYVASMGSYYAKNLSKLGFSQSIEKIKNAHSTGGSKAAAEAVDNRLIDELSLVGSAEEIREKLSIMPSGVIPVIAVDQSFAEDTRRLKSFQPLIDENL